MFENLLELVKQHAGEAIVNNPSIPNERNDEAISEVSNSISGSLQGLFQGGGVKDLLGMFGGGNQNAAMSNVSQQVSGGLVGNLMSKFGLNNQAASGIAGSLIPNILGSLVHKTNDPNDSSFNLQNVFNGISGGSTSGMNLDGLMTKVKSGALDLDGDGDTDLNDLMSVAGKGGAGGLLDQVKGLFH
ncbi:MAG: hypothetical protein JST06_08120 [Bacteroidetes bacterium]|nr:hypothetical protein [Bacteroidota bacterium]MBS1628719.1 hypothetical protein [Bacteroidota bacterium]